MQIATRRSAKFTILEISGEIDLSHSPQLRAILLREIKDLKAPGVALNLSAVKYIDSSGVASLIEGLKAARDVKARFVLFALSTTVREVMQLSKLIKVFEIHETEEQAIAE